LDKFVLFFLFL